MTNLGDAVAAHYANESAARRDRDEDELRKFTPDPQLDAAVERMEAMHAAQPGVMFGSIASSLVAYKNRRDKAAAFAAREADSTGDDAA